MTSNPLDFSPARDIPHHPAEDRLHAVVQLCGLASRLCLDHLDTHPERCRCGYCRSGHGPTVRPTVAGLAWQLDGAPALLSSDLIGADLPDALSHLDALAAVTRLVRRLR